MQRLIIKLQRLTIPFSPITIKNYTPVRQAAAYETLQQTYKVMLQSQQQETEMEARLKATRDRAREAKWAFHNAVVAMKQSVLGQFGPDSDEIQAVGYKKKAERKCSRRRKPNSVTSTPPPVSFSERSLAPE